MRILKAQRKRHLLAGGVFGLSHDVGLARCYDGEYVTSWGLNLSRDQLRPYNDYVHTGEVWAGKGGAKRDNYELILGKVSK